MAKPVRAGGSHESRCDTAYDYSDVAHIGDADVQVAGIESVAAVFDAQVTRSRLVNNQG